MTTIKINLSLTVQVESGPQLACPINLQVQAYGKLDIEVPAATTTAGTTTSGTANVDLQPSAGNRVKLLLIKPNVTPVTNLAYIVSDGDPTSEKKTGSIDLNEPHLYTADMIALFKTATGERIDPKVLKFTNDNDKKIAIEILVGRDPVIGV